MVANLAPLNVDTSSAIFIVGLHQVAVRGWPSLAVFECRGWKLHRLVQATSYVLYNDISRDLERTAIIQT